MNKFSKIIAPAIAASLALGAVAPASAASWNQPNRFDVRQQISQLDRQINQAERRNMLSHREAENLERKVDQLRDLHARYARNGLTKGELRLLDQRIDQVSRQIDREINDRNNHRGGYRR